MNDNEEKLISGAYDRGELKLEEPSADLLRKLAEASENSSKPGNVLGDNMPEIARFYGIIRDGSFLREKQVDTFFWGNFILSRHVSPGQAASRE